jgi:hypothetical protein
MHWLDALYLRWTKRQPLFERGWGDVDGPLAQVPALLTRSIPEPLVLEFLPTSARTDEAFVASPAPLLEHATSRLHVMRLRAKGPNRARLIVPPSWGDEGFGLRSYLVNALRYHGVEVWLFEGAYFGSRRAQGQRRVGLHTVGDFLRMGLANVFEARALVMTALTMEPKLPVALAGYSMGGQMSAHAAASLDVDLPVTVMAPSDDASVVFCDGPLSKSVTWSALGDDGVERLRVVLRGLSVLAQPAPRSSRRFVVATKTDGIVPPSSMEAIAKHWSVAPTHVDSGHLGAYALHRGQLVDVMLKALP